MARQSLTTPSLICVNVQLLPSNTATADCYIFSSLVQCNNTPTDLYITLASPQHVYHTQTPLPAGISTAALRDAFRQPDDTHTTAYHFHLHEDKAAATAAGHTAADAILYVRKDKRDKRAWLTVALTKNDSHRSDRLLQDLQKLFQRLQETIAQHEANSTARSASTQHKLALLQQKVRTKQHIDNDMRQCTLLLLKEKRDELARCEKEYNEAVRARREATRDKVRKEREAHRQARTELVGGEDEETDSEGQTTSQDEEAEIELSRLNEELEDVPVASVADAVMQDDENGWQHGQRQEEEHELNTASFSQRNPSVSA